jgi:hypothetical protein
MTDDMKAPADAAWKDTCADYARRLEAETQRQRQQAEADALRRAFGTKPRKPLKPARQDDLFNPDPQARLTFSE